jgi:hypothetical protein
MSVHVNEILKKLEKGDINSDQALKEINYERQDDEVYNSHFLHIQVTRMNDDRPRVNVRIPLRMLKTGLDIGAVYAPELRDLDLKQVLSDLHSYADGSIVEFEDYESDERVLIAIEQIQD